MSSRTVKLENLSRVEGEGGLLLRLEDGKVQDVRLNIFEPPRFFEAFLRGRHFNEVPDLTARICGICPVAYQMSAVHAIENALGVVLDPSIRALRRLLYCAEWIQSHALHIYLLQAPDFLGYESAISMAPDHRARLEQGLRLKKIGNDLLVLLGGRAIHPVSVCVGGLYRVPTRARLLEFRTPLHEALELAVETVHWVAGFTFPDFNPEYEFVSLCHPDEYPMNEGRIVSSRGVNLDASEFEHAFLEEHVEHSTALHSVRARQGTSYFVGPLARLNMNQERLRPRAMALLKSVGLAWPCHNPYFGIVARAIEIVQACEEALSIIDLYEEPRCNRSPVQVSKSEGCAATEAPRGLLFHRYSIREDGLIERARIVPPTSQNLRRIEEDLKLRLESVSQEPDGRIIAISENLVRTYDPCISCSTHFLRINIIRG